MKTVVFTLSSTVAGIILGAALGLCGGLLPLTFRITSISVLAVAGIAVGILELRGRRFQPLEFGRETPKRWVNAGPLHWAVWTGAALGVGITSRIGFWLWYSVPIGALLLGQPVFGALLYGTYGFVRSAAVWVVYFGVKPGTRAPDTSEWLLGNTHHLRRIAAGQLVAVGFIGALTVGI